MTLFYLLLLVLVIQWVSGLLDRGTRERRRWLSNRGQAEMRAVLQNCRKRGLRLTVTSESEWQEGDSPRFIRFVQSMARVVDAFQMHRLDVTLLVACWLVGKLSFMPTWLPSMLVATLLMCEPWYSMRVLRLNRAGSLETPISRAIEWPIRVVSIGLCFTGLHLASTLAAPGLVRTVLPQGLWDIAESLQSLSGGWWPLVIAVGAYTLCFAAALLEGLGHRVASLRYLPFFAGDTHPDAVLFLRSFSDDSRMLRASGASSPFGSLLCPWIGFEEYISMAALKTGNLVCIGNPKEIVPLSGGQRAYYRPRRDAIGRADEWRTAVEETARRARLVVLTAGTTAGLDWEVQHLRDWELLGKCLFLFPPDSDRGTERRLNSLLCSVGLPSEQIKEAAMIPGSLLCAVTVRRTRKGRLLPTYYFSAGRDHLSYRLVIDMFKDREDTDAHRIDAHMSSGSESNTSESAG